jgi:hypothetical protein
VVKISSDLYCRIPKITIAESKGLSSVEIYELEAEMKSLAEKMKGEVMIYQILTHGEVRKLSLYKPIL